MISSFLKDKQLNIVANTAASNLPMNVKTLHNPTYSSYDALRDFCWNKWNFGIHFGYNSKEH